MEVCICVPLGADISLLESEYPDMQEDGPFDDHKRYFVGLSSDEEKEGEEWLTHDEAVACCGFAEGVIEGCNTLIEGNGPWAQGMISRTDFSTLAFSKAEKRSRKRISKIYWQHFKRGQEAQSVALSK